MQKKKIFFLCKTKIFFFYKKNIFFFYKKNIFFVYKKKIFYLCKKGPGPMAPVIDSQMDLDICVIDEQITASQISSYLDILHDLIHGP